MWWMMATKRTNILTYIVYGLREAGEDKLYCRDILSMNGKTIGEYRGIREGLGVNGRVGYYLGAADDWIFSRV